MTNAEYLDILRMQFSIEGAVSSHDKMDRFARHAAELCRRGMIQPVEIDADGSPHSMAKIRCDVAVRNLFFPTLRLEIDVFVRRFSRQDIDYLISKLDNR